MLKFVIVIHQNTETNLEYVYPAKLFRATA